MDNRLIYITIDNWEDYGEKINDFVNKLEDHSVDVNCNITIYDMALNYHITTTESYIKKHNLEFLKEFYEDEKTDNHPNYDLSKIGTKNNYRFLYD